MNNIMNDGEFKERVEELYHIFNVGEAWATNSFYFASVVGAMLSDEPMTIYEGTHTLDNFIKNHFDSEHWIWNYIKVIPYHIKKARWVA